MTQDSATPDATSDHPDGLDATPDRDHDEGLEGLEGLDEVPVSEHVARFTRVHDALRARLDGQPGHGPDQQPEQEPGSGDGPRVGSAR